MSRKRVLIVDDTAIYRAAIKACLSKVDELEVVGIARDGNEALLRIAELEPDLVTLDVEMPGKDGLDVLRSLSEACGASKPRIVVFSAHSSEGATITIEALRLGADDFVLKPTAADGIQAIERDLIPRLLALSGSRPTHQPGPMAEPTPSRAGTATIRRSANDKRRARRILAIAASTGGPNALREALEPFPASFPVPIVIVQHMPPLFTKQLAESLSRTCNLPTHEAIDGEPIQPGHAYIAPGGWHLQVRKQNENLYCALDDGPTIFGLRPAADTLFRSMADICGSQTLAAIFTGMGRDGSDGLRSLPGAAVLTQTEESCTVYGMPQAVDAAGMSHGHFTPATFYDSVSRYNLCWQS